MVPKIAPILAALSWYSRKPRAAWVVFFFILPVCVYFTRFYGLSLLPLVFHYLGAKSSDAAAERAVRVRVPAVRGCVRAACAAAAAGWHEFGHRDSAAERRLTFTSKLPRGANQASAHIRTRAPSSTTALSGKRKNSTTFPALRLMAANIACLQRAICVPRETTNVSRLKKKLV